MRKCVRKFSCGDVAGVFLVTKTCQAGSVFLVGGDSLFENTLVENKHMRVNVGGLEIILEVLLFLKFYLFSLWDS